MEQRFGSGRQAGRPPLSVPGLQRRGRMPDQAPRPERLTRSRDARTGVRCEAPLRQRITRSAHSFAPAVSSRHHTTQERGLASEPTLHGAREKTCASVPSGASCGPPTGVLMGPIVPTRRAPGPHGSESPVGRRQHLDRDPEQPHLSRGNRRAWCRRVVRQARTRQIGARLALAPLPGADRAPSRCPVASGISIVADDLAPSATAEHSSDTASELGYARERAARLDRSHQPELVLQAAAVSPD